MDIDRALINLRRLTPDAIEQLPARKNAAGLFHEMFEQTKLRRAQINLAGPAMHAARFPIERDIACDQLISHALRLGAAQQCANARNEFSDAPAPAPLRLEEVQPANEAVHEYADPDLEPPRRKNDVFAFARGGRR